MCKQMEFFQSQLPPPDTGFPSPASQCHRAQWDTTHANVEHFADISDEKHTQRDVEAAVSCL